MSKLRGAGAILHSPLVHNGFRFPEVELIEEDESYLLEIEVKVKLGKHDIFFQLQDILVDFPVEVLLQRPGLLQGLIDNIRTYLVTIEDHGMCIYITISMPIYLCLSNYHLSLL